MQSNEIVTDYGWNEPTTAAHKYLLKTLKSVLTNMNVSKNANILDAGCGGDTYYMNSLRCVIKMYGVLIGPKVV